MMVSNEQAPDSHASSANSGPSGADVADLMEAGHREAAGQAPGSHYEASTGTQFKAFLRWLEYIPRRCRWNEKNLPKFNWAMCLLFAFAAAFTVSNLYYNHPILNILADDFNVSFEEASRVPTVMQAGYAGGLLFLCPVGDIIRRRPFALALVFLTVNIWLGLCLTTSFSAFLGLSFAVGLTTVTPQLMLPLVAELAPQKRKAMMISIVYGGLLMGILIARILSGIVTQFTSWRVLYFTSFGIQYAILILLFLFLPDYPKINHGISYLRIMWTILTIPTRQPLLVQTSIIAFLTSAVFVSYWTTLTFLLASPPYNLSTVDIGLFALIGMPPFIVNPWVSHHLTNKYHPLLATIVALSTALAGVCIGTFIGKWTPAGPILMGLLLDLGMTVSQTACRTLLVPVEPEARNRVNTVFMTSAFCGMLTGTATGNALYARGGWVYSGAADIAGLSAALLIAVARGPHENGWAGWRGGWNLRVAEEKGNARDNGGGDTETYRREKA